MNLFSRLFCKKKVSNNVEYRNEQKTEDIAYRIKERLIARKAKANTFDMSFFKNDVGEFVFPKYNKIKSIVKITDTTEYNNFYSLDKKNLLNYTFDDFESDLSLTEADIEVEDFKLIFNKKDLKGLPVLNKLKGKDDLIKEMLTYVETKENNLFYFPEDIQKQLVKYGFIHRIDLNESAYIDFIDEYCTSYELKSLCKTNNIKPVSGSKIQLAERLIRANANLPKAYMITDSFINYIHDLSNLYISDIENSLKIFHPLYHQTIWEAVEDVNINDYPPIMSYINNKLKEQKWETLLESIKQ